MKFLFPLSLLTLATVFSPVTQAHSERPALRRSYQVGASLYCQEARFQNYMALATSMRDFVTPHEYERLYLPLKIRSSKALVTLKNYGPLSSTTHKALYEIVSFVSSHEKEFDSLWEVEAFFPVAQDLVEMTQALSRDLQ